jgi:glycosyltransferase involved in cell wall biosynthesis
MDTLMQDITALVVSYKAKEALQTTYNSFRRFYPAMPLIIIEGSPKKHPCRDYAVSLDATVVECNYNIGHGRGMNVGICLADTRYVLIFDSDIEFIAPCVEKMLELFDENVVTVGEQYEMGIKGIRSVNVPYVHPWFHIIDREMYFKYFPYVHSGAPTHIHNADIYLRGHAGDAYRNFPVAKYVRHFKGGTRAINDDIDGKKAERKSGEADVRLFLRCEKGLEVRNRRMEKIV